MDRRPGSERSRTASLEENEEMAEDLSPGIHITRSDRKINWHQPFICEKNGKNKRIETIQAWAPKKYRKL